MDPFQRAIVGPPVEIAVHRAAVAGPWEWNATGSRYPALHHAVDHLAHDDCPLAAAALAGGINGSICAHSSSVRSLG